MSAHRLVFNSQFTRRRFGSTSPASASVSYPIVDLGRFQELPLPSCKPTDSPVLGVVGQITPWKGQDDAVRILALVRQHLPRARLRIIGSAVFIGPGVSLDNEGFARRLTALAEELGVLDSVEFTGEAEDTPAAYGALDVLLVPSWEEPFGRVVAEGMASGVPVVATSLGGPAELIEHGVSGFLAPPRGPAAWVEPVLAVLQDPTVAREIAIAARKRITTVVAAENPVVGKRFSPGSHQASRSPSTARRGSVDA
jgi:glycosyltransferase involved in cell wall biosynthesis